MADEEESNESTEQNLRGAGESLKRAREKQSLSIEDIAKTTRIPQRHLTSLETGDYDALPGRTYAIGFGKSYARAVGLSDATIGSQLREEMDDQGHTAYQPEMSDFDPNNPSSIPPRYLAWTAVAIAGVVLVGYLVWRTLILSPAGIDPIANETQTNAQEVAVNSAGQSTAGAEPEPSADGTVILTATEQVWMKIYDAEGKRLFEAQLAAGETYTVPGNANDPQILTGRPDALTVTIDGQVLPPLGTAERTIKDVGVSARALLAREQSLEQLSENTDG